MTRMGQKQFGQGAAYLAPFEGAKAEMPHSSVEVSVIVPVFNEGENIGALTARLVPLLAGATASFEILFVDDGSSDDDFKNVGNDEND